MRPFLFACAVLAAAAATTCAAAQEPPPPALKGAETCMRDNAGLAVQSSSGAADAAAFLVGYLCAGPVETAALYDRNSATLRNLRLMLESSDEANEDADWMAGMVVDPVTGELDLKSAKGEDAQSGLMAMQMLSGMGIFGGRSGNEAPAFIRETAARFVMEHRR
ncbi:hypothetical protein [Brevundimonas sp.]|uniref:hypothetical protein n=1 Tax=Brevundimonas sp. TaxID=1871086 RepID=UPI002ED7C450